MNIKDFKWTREPDDYTLTDDKIEIITQPGTDLWQRTYYHFRNDNAPVLQIETEEKFFSFIVKTDFKESHHRFAHIQGSVVPNIFSFVLVHVSRDNYLYIVY